MSEPDGVIGTYRRHAAAFDRRRTRRLDEQAWLDRFLAQLPDGAEVLDLGCGHGEPVAAYLIEKGCRVTGVDASPPLIALCRNRFPAHDWRVGDMRAANLGRSFDGVLGWDSFFFLTYDEQRAMFPAFRDLVHPGGALMFNAGPRHGEAMGAFEGEPLHHFSLAQEDYRALLDANGFEVVAHQADAADASGRSPWLAKARMAG
ncbi:MAG: methyltransferase domain-containing protein [Alphaproteobacteria bacterium]|nr:methyltransferase domain-containing protein [Alphaproteobacteria bacterium]